MGLDTRLRNRIKKEYDSGANIYTILHPNTQSAEPESLRIESDIIRQQILSNNFTNVKSNRGYTSKINTKVDYDLNHAERVYIAFGINIKSDTKVVQLQAALENYQSTKESRDDKELKQDLIKDTIIALKRSNITAVQIQQSFVRSSVIDTVITLESLATHLNIEFNLEVLDAALAILIKEQIDLL